MEMLSEDYLELSKSVKSKIIDELLLVKVKSTLVDNIIVEDSIKSPLINALLNDKDEDVLRLLEQGADVNTVFKDNKSTTTALMEAARYHHVESAKSLLLHGADTEVINEDGETALFLACKSGCFEIAEVLIQYGANVNHRRFDGSTPMMVVNFDSIAGNEILQCLIEHGADISMTNEDGRSAVDLFKMSGDYDCYQACNQYNLLHGYEDYRVYDESDDYGEIYF